MKAISSPLRCACVCLLAALIAAPAVAQSQALTSSKGRKLAPDAMQVIPPSAEWGETFQGPIDLKLVAENPDLVWTPNFDAPTSTLVEKAKSLVFRGDVYCLQFEFKPVRMIQVDVPIDGKMQSKNVWYLLYRVSYRGGDLRPVPEPDQFNNKVYSAPQAVSAKWVRFMPTFYLDTLGLGKVYLDQVIPAAKRAIAARERVGAPIYDSIEMQTKQLDITNPTADNALWGVATWIDVDPRTDFFAIGVKGLTNAQKLVQEDGKTKYLQKTLVLHFSRPGDTMNETQDRIRFGIPALQDEARQAYILQQYGQKERLDYVWDYR